MRYPCPHCRRPVRQVRNTSGPNFCPRCCKLFYMPEPEKVPPWILGVVVVLLGNWQVMSNVASMG